MTCLRLAVSLTLLIGCATHPAPLRTAPVTLPDEITAYLNAAFDTVRRVSRHENVPWDRIRDSMTLLSEGARVPADVYPVIDWMLTRVDRHSFLQSPRFGVRDADLGNRTAYLRVPFWGNTAMLPVLSDTLQEMIRRHDAAGACRWVIDLRANGGGNMWPMLAGIGPLLGDSLVGGSTSPRGRTQWKYVNGAASLVHEDGRVETLVTATTPVLALREPHPAIAVLIDGGTGSSGEVMAVSFKGRSRTRHFGSPSAGVSTTNQGYRLPDGRNMVITVGTTVDRTGAAYGKPVEPDLHVVTPLAGPSMLRGDPVVREALNWLSQQHCTAGGRS
jgi:hypothetical protein